MNPPKQTNKNFWQEKEKDIIIHEGGKMNIIESCVDRHALQNPDSTAFVFEDEKGLHERFSYMQVEKEISKYANFLMKIGMKKGSRIFIFLPKIKEAYFSILAAIKLGAVSAPLFEAFQQEGLELRLERGEANLLITNKELGQRLKNKIKGMKILIVDSDEFKEELKKQKEEFETKLVDKKDTALMIFTSSTAGTPVAGIEIPHYALVQQHYTAKLVLKLEKEDRYFCTAHPGWVTGSVYGIVAPLSIGSSIYIYQGHFEAKKWIDFLKENKISVIYTAPTALRLLKNDIKKKDFESVKNICSVGEHLEESVFDFYLSIGEKIRDTYWQTETGAIIIAAYEDKIISGSMGKAIPGINIKIIDKTIHIERPWPSMMAGIYKHEKMYKDYFFGKWFKTNDMAEEKKGNFYFIGRKDDIIKTSGERVSPLEIENILMKHKAVREVGVIGKGDEIKGQIIKAFIVLNSTYENLNEQEREKLKEELSLFVKQNYAGHSYPKEIDFVSELPKTNSGKIIRMKLREMEEKK
jgi:acetyl-CoA synthetase